MPSDGKSSHCLWQGELKKYAIHFPIWSYVKLFLVLAVILDHIGSTKKLQIL